MTQPGPADPVPAGSRAPTIGDDPTRPIARPVEADRADTATGPSPGPEFVRTTDVEVDLAGMAVRRALPRRQRRTVGAWCFVDHFGPATAPAQPPMQVGPHPHVGLQTVTWLVEGEVVHHDSLGSEQVIRPGQLNLMTAGWGVAHAEETRPGAPVTQHGAQLWVAQPESTRNGPPAFEHHADLPRLPLGGWEGTVLVGEVGGVRSPARTDTPLVGAALSSAGPGHGSIGLRPDFEHALVVLHGGVTLSGPGAGSPPGSAPAPGDGEVVRPGELVYLGLGREELLLTSDGPTHVLLLGGEPFPEPLRMWWNFVGRTRDELRQAGEDWNAGSNRFGDVASALPRIPAPAFLAR